MNKQMFLNKVFIPQTGQQQVIVGAADKATFKRAIDEVLLNKK